MAMNLSSGLKICIATILILIVGQCSVQGEKKLNIVKGTKKLSRARLAGIKDTFKVCGDKFKPFKFKAVLVAHPLGSNNIGVRIEVHTTRSSLVNGVVNTLMIRDHNFVAAYEVEKVVFDGGEKNYKETARETLEGNVCNYFGVEESNLYNLPLYYIKFKYSTDEDWWCDTYYGYDLKYMELDKCNELIKDYDAGSIYTGATNSSSIHAHLPTQTLSHQVIWMITNQSELRWRLVSCMSIEDNC
ncbi:uncharacterized protein LOC129005470 isoform X2 [Macrosteles quadrilineatus]|uniref:uncharacterized protein LOC129005470 isoform X2 n=1 Tax=Macrosteles quadrilineatus TaxID=74068 RepID=UPI0023E1F63C|nr:uncharacterized protein LOC129005470 isoform X2 [Macrosteles quadrilineatus]